MPTKKQLSISMESQFEFPETRRDDDPMKVTPNPPPMNNPNPEEITENDFFDALYESNGSGSGAEICFELAERLASLRERETAIGFAEWLRNASIIPFVDHDWSYNDDAITGITPNQAFDKYLEHLTQNKKV